MVMARITFCTLARVSAISAMASRMGGIGHDAVHDAHDDAVERAHVARDEADDEASDRGQDGNREADASETRAPYSTRE